MLPIYFPSDIVREEAVVSALLDPSSKQAFSFSVDYRTSMDEPPRTETDTLLRTGERVPEIFLVGGSTIVPLTKVVIRDGDERSDPLIGLDPVKNTMESFARGIVPTKFSGCHRWVTPKDLDTVIFTLFARATNIGSIKDLPSPSSSRHNFDDVKKRTTPQPKESDTTVTLPTSGLVYYCGVWYKFVGENLYDINTNDLKHSGVIASRQQVYIPENEEWHKRKDRAFSFESKNKLGRLWSYSNNPIIFNHEIKPTDPEFGKKFFASFGIKYDVYESLIIKENGEVDNSQFLKGKHDFAVIKRSCLILDLEGATELYESVKVETVEQPKETKAAKFRTVDRSFEGHVKDLNRILSPVVLGLEDRINKKCMHHYLVRRLIDFLHERLREGNGATLSNEEIFKKITKAVDIYIPVATPHFTNEVCGILNTLFKAEQKNISQFSLSSPFHNDGVIREDEYEFEEWF